MTGADRCSDCGSGPPIDVPHDSPTKKQRLSGTASPTMHEHAGRATPRSSRCNSAATSSPVLSQPVVRAQSAPLSFLEFQIRLEDVELCRRADGTLWNLGKGSFGTVYKAMKGVETVAVKVCGMLLNEEDKEAFHREVAILKACRNRNIVAFLGEYVDTERTWLIMEYMEAGDLFKALKKDREGALRWNKRAGGPGVGRKIALDVARGLTFLHSNRIAHMDLKTLNVLLDRFLNAKICDVGMSKLLQGDQTTPAFANPGTLAWSAPELLMNQPFTEKVDIYSFGVILWELCTGEVPARGKLRAVRVPEECSESVAGIVAACLSDDPDRRPTARELVDKLSRAAQEGASGARPRAKRASVDDRCDLDPLTASVHALANVVYPRDVNSAAAAIASALTGFGVAIYRGVVMELKKCLEEPDVESEGSQTNRRVLDIVGAGRKMWTLKMHSNPALVGSVKNVNYEKLGEAERRRLDQEGAELGSGPKAGPRSANVPGTESGGRSTTRSESTLDLRYEARTALPVTHWRPVVQALRLRPDQEHATVEILKREQATLKALRAERKALLMRMQTLGALSTTDAQHASIEATLRLKDLGDEEACAQAGIIIDLLFNLWDPLQQARAMCVSWPYQISSEAVAELIASDICDPDYLIMGDTGGMDGPDARLAFLEAVMDPEHKRGGYTTAQISDPELYLPLVAQAYPMYLKHLQECFLTNDVDEVGSATHSRVASLLFLRRCLIFSGIQSNVMFLSGLLEWNSKVRAGARPRDVWEGVADAPNAVRVPPPPEPWQHVVTVAKLTAAQIAKIADFRRVFITKTAALQARRVELARSLQACPHSLDESGSVCIGCTYIRAGHICRRVVAINSRQDVVRLQMRTACQHCGDLTRQIQEAACEELRLYNEYFVDILFRSMQPRQQGRITCMSFPYLTDVEFIADAVVAKAATDAAAAEGGCPRVDYVSAVRSHIGIVHDEPITMSQLAAHNVAKVLREAGMQCSMSCVKHHC